MATSSTSVADLYTEIIEDIRIFFADAVLITNPQFLGGSPQFLGGSFNIAGASGDTVRIPIANGYDNAVAVSEGTSIRSNGVQNDFDPTNLTISLVKYGAYSDVNEEAFEDGGLAVVRQNVVDRIAGGLAQAVDVAGFEALRDAGGNMSLYHASKREPSVRAWYDNDFDRHQFVGSTRQGFKVVYNGTNTGNNYGVRKLDDVRAIGSGTLTLNDFAKSVANLRENNHSPMASGFYPAFVAASTELNVASQLNSVTSGTIGDLSAIGNRALLTGLIGQAAGIEWYRSNNLPQPS
jgi:hypothetical protein